MVENAEFSSGPENSLNRLIVRWVFVDVVSSDLSPHLADVETGVVRLYYCAPDTVARSHGTTHMWYCDHTTTYMLR
jgi:hypothetical protein